MMLAQDLNDTAENLRARSARAVGLADRMRHDTRDLHDTIEANPRFVRLMAADLTRDEYRGLLARLYGHHAAMEAALERSEHLLPAALELTRRLRRTTLMAADLHALGMSLRAVAELPRCPVGRCASVEAAWGSLYVLEGATLGGQIIARHLATCLGLGTTNGAAGIVPYGTETGSLWRDFKRLLSEASARGEVNDDAVVRAARAAFVDLDFWVGQDG